MLKAMLFIPEKNSYIVFQRFNQNTPSATSFPSLRILKYIYKVAAGQYHQFMVNRI